MRNRIVYALKFVSRLASLDSKLSTLILYFYLEPSNTSRELVKTEKHHPYQVSVLGQGRGINKNPIDS